MKDCRINSGIRKKRFILNIKYTRKISMKAVLKNAVATQYGFFTEFTRVLYPKFLSFDMSFRFVSGIMQIIKK